VVKSQVADIIDLILQLIGHPNGVYRPCRNRKSRGAVLSTSEGQWATTKFDGVWKFFVSSLKERYYIYFVYLSTVKVGFTLQDLFTILGNPNHMILMMVCAVGTEFDLHAYMVSKPPDENLQPSAAGFHPRANARRPQPDFWIGCSDKNCQNT
jgi:hypothetical protein